MWQHSPLELVMSSYAGLTKGFDGGEEACSAGRAADGAVLFDLTATTSIL